MLASIRIGAWLWLAAVVPWSVTTAEESLLPGMVNPGYHQQPDWFKVSFLDIREDVEEAAADGKRLMVYFYQDGCPYCEKLLETNFGLRDIATKTQATVNVVSINMWGDREVTGLDGRLTTEKQFAEDLKVMFTPTLLVFNEQAEVIMRVNGYYAPHQFDALLDYIADRKEAEMSFRDYYAARAPAEASGKLHQDDSFLQPPYRLASRDSDKPLLVLFEQKVCAPCDELHLDILQREESRVQLARFDVALLDIRSRDSLQRPDGSTGSVRDWVQELDVQYAPTLVMFDAQGQEAFRTEAYLRTFHVQSALAYVASGAYKDQPNFQRYLQARAADLEARGIHVDLMD
ncbi:MAG TPA: thioredoxin fold domain-containing protein [Gammaproteobacteria bacterium]|nr:thioredoxin fold domain-containing protein [Gammaproteobacteria bacterium]